jgi:ubiquinone/menaquinone biosynthesis C-methylase UbiE
VRDDLLQRAEPLDGATLLDLGAGDGLIGLGALDRVGPEGTVIFCDISEALLEQCREAVRSRGSLKAARFVMSRAEVLAGIADASVDIVAARAVLLFVADKRAAFSAMYRVLRPGGRISLREPLGQLMYPEPEDRLWGYDVSRVIDLAAKVKAAFAALEDPSFRAAMMDFDDRDLARLAESAGFDRVHVECHIDMEPGALIPAASAQALLQLAPTPTAPTLGEAVEASLTQSERQRFLIALDRAIGEGKPIRRTASVYVLAGKGP